MLSALCIPVTQVWSTRGTSVLDLTRGYVMSERHYAYRPYRLPSGTWVIAEYLNGKLSAHLEHSFHTRFEAESFLKANHWPSLDSDASGYTYRPLMVSGWWTIGEYLDNKFQNHVGTFYTSKEEVEHFLDSNNWPRWQELGDEDDWWQELEEDK